MNLVSVIVPIYNVETYLPKCIDSIIDQTLTNIEIILVNDGSTDKSGQICDEYKIKDNRIKVIHKENGGLSDARNSGIEISKGEYLVFIDSDDWIDRNMIKKLYDLSIKYNADIVQGDYVKVYSDDDIIIINTSDTEINCYDPEQALELLHSEKGAKTIVTWNKIYKRSLFNDIKFPKGKYHEDEFTTYKVLYKANKIVDCNIPLVYYRQREGSIMNSKFNIKRLDALEAFNEKLQFYREKNLNELQQITLRQILSYTNKFYIKIKDSDIENKDEILKVLRQSIKKDYMLFMDNKYVSLKQKILLTIFVLNKEIFYKVYKNKVNKK